MKKTRQALLFVLVLCLLIAPVSAATGSVQATLYYNDIGITINGQWVKTVDVNGSLVEPFAIDGTTYIPVRAVSEAFGYDVVWDGATSTVLVTTPEGGKNPPAIGEAPEKKGSRELKASLDYLNIKIKVDGNLIDPVNVRGETVEPFAIEGTTYVPVRALSGALGYDVDWDGATSTVILTSSVLKAGAGVGDINFPKAMFPFEGFSGEVNDTLHARVLLVSNGTKVAIVSLEMVNVPEDLVETCKKIVGEQTGTPKDNIWIHATHTITSPHAPSEAAARELYVNAITSAVETAAKQAASTYQDAVMGVSTSRLDINANRDIQLNGEWYYGLGSTMASNKTMTIMRFNSTAGEPIGFFISYGIKPTCIDNVEMAASTRKLSADVPGVACTLMEEEFGVPAMFCMPAAGDQIPKEIANYYRLDSKGEVEFVEHSVAEGVEMMERQGKIMGQAAIALAKTINCNQKEPTVLATSTAYNYSNKAGDGEVKVVVEGIRLGNDIALVGLKPETNAITELELWETSPFKHTLIVSFLNGDQKYMPDKASYPLNTWEVKRAGMAAGCAEKFVEVSKTMLTDLLAGKTYNHNSGQGSGGGDGTKSTVEFGGYTWVVLEVRDGKSLIMTEDVLEYRAYHGTDTAVTWEESDIRAYLNGEFFSKAFTDAEKAKIVETTITNPSNAKYGIRGGNDTKDKVFLLSLQEAETYLFGFTDLLAAKDVSTGEAAWWHLRSPGEALNVAACVSATGMIDYHGVQSGVTDPTGGVRPAMWVDLG